MTSLLVAKARVIARAAHFGQMRLEGERYFAHPDRVAHKAMMLDLPDHAVAAAYLHDVIEDCELTWNDVALLLSPEDAATVTVNLVVELTNVARPSDGNRAKRMAINREHTFRISPLGKTLKCLDVHDNLSSPFDDAVWAKKYFAEKELELGVLKDADPRAWALAYGVWLKGPTVVPKCASQDLHDGRRE